MYYRRKIMLALLEKSGDTLGRLKLQKLLFLISQEQEMPSFDFVPYKFGAYSFRAAADAGTLVKYGILSTEKSKSWRKETPELFFPQLKKKDQQVVSAICRYFGRFSGRDLIEYTYRKYPEYEFFNKKDIYLFLGTTQKHHNTSRNPFVIIGVFYPKKETQYKLF
jgi:hypothetical protein